MKHVASNWQPVPHNRHKEFTARKSTCKLKKKIMHVFTVITKAREGVCLAHATETERHRTVQKSAYSATPLHLQKAEWATEGPSCIPANHMLASLASVRLIRNHKPLCGICSHMTGTQLHRKISQKRRGARRSSKASCGPVRSGAIAKGVLRPAQLHVSKNFHGHCVMRMPGTTTRVRAAAQGQRHLV